MKSTFLITFSLLLFLNGYTQKSNYYAITNSGNRIELYNRIELIPGEIHHFPKNDKGRNKLEKINQDSIRLLVAGEKYFVGVLNKKNRQRLKEVIAFNDEYIMLETYRALGTSGQHDIYLMTVIDREFNIIEPAVKIYSDNQKINYNKEIFKDKIEPYFEDCPELLNRIYDNMADGGPGTGRISNFKCGNSKEVFPNVNRSIVDVEVELPSTVANIEKNYEVTEKGIKKDVIESPQRLSKAKQYGTVQDKLRSLKYMVVDKRIYLTLEAPKKLYDVYEVVAYNDNFILTYDLVEKFTYHIYDRNYKLIENNINKVDILKKLETYFNDCSKLSESIKMNLPLKKKFKNELNYYNCDNSAPLTR